MGKLRSFVVDSGVGQSCTGLVLCASAEMPFWIPHASNASLPSGTSCICEVLASALFLQDAQIPLPVSPGSLEKLHQKQSRHLNRSDKSSSGDHVGQAP